MADAITISAAKRHYKRNSPLHGSSRQHKADLEVISKSPQPNSKADTLIIRRQADTIDRKVEVMLIKQQGRRKRFTYNQSAVIGLEHLVDGPLDPHTQAPLWHKMIRRSKGTTLTKADFMAGTSDDLVVSLPTSAGKTRIAELCILRCLADGKRVIFVTPLRALSAQTERSLQNTFGILGVSISALYGSIGTSEVPLVS